MASRQCSGSWERPVAINSAMSEFAVMDFGDCPVCHQSIGLDHVGREPVVTPHKPTRTGNGARRRLRSRFLRRAGGDA